MLYDEVSSHQSLTGSLICRDKEMTLEAWVWLLHKLHGFAFIPSDVTSLRRLRLADDSATPATPFDNSMVSFESYIMYYQSLHRLTNVILLLIYIYIYIYLCSWG